MTRNRRGTTTKALGLAITALAALPLATANAAIGDLAPVSVNNNGSQATTASSSGVTSATGQYVAFLSAENLTGADTGGKLQVYVRDRSSGTTVLASSNASGAAANADVEAGESFNPYIDISSDGKYVVFGSSATNLVADDTNGKADVFKKDLVTGQVTRPAVYTTYANSSSGELVQGNGDSRDPSISGNGLYVAFVTDATDLDASKADNNSAADVVLAGSAWPRIVSTNTAGEPANGFTERPSISADGRFVAFEAGPATTNLYAGDTNGENDIVVKALTERTADGIQAPGTVTPVAPGSAPDISGNGRFVAFQSSTALDSANDTNGFSDVYMGDVKAATMTLASARNGLGLAGNGASNGAAISADGARVAFTSDATNLDIGDGNGVADVFARTLNSRGTTRLSQDRTGAEQSQLSGAAGVSGNGGIGTFTSASPFNSADTNSVADVYTREMIPTDTMPPTIVKTTYYPGGISRYDEGAYFLLQIEDESGIVLINGHAATRSMDGSAFYLGSPSYTQPVKVSVTDGAGNTLAAALTPGGPPPYPAAPVKPKVTKVEVARRHIRAYYKTGSTGAAKIWLEKVTYKKGKLKYLRVGKTRNFRAKETANRRVSLPRPKKGHGIYRVVMRAPYMTYDELDGLQTVQIKTTRRFRL